MSDEPNKFQALVTNEKDKESKELNTIANTIAHFLKREEPNAEDRALAREIYDATHTQVKQAGE